MRQMSAVVRPVTATAALLCAVLMLSACSSGSSISSGNGQGFISGDGSTVVLAPDERQPAPEVSGTTLQGDELALTDFAGDVVVLNVWGSWCAPCRAEAATLQEVSDEFTERGVQFVGINTRDDQADAKAFERNFGITYPSLVDPDGQLQLRFRDSLPPTSIPSTLVIDREGRVAARVLGPTSYLQLKGLVEDVAAESQPSQAGTASS